MNRWAVYGKLKEWLFDIKARTKSEAWEKAKEKNPNATYVIRVVPGNDLGVRGL